MIKWLKISVTSSRENTLKPLEPRSFPKLHYLVSYLMKNFFCRKLSDTMEGIIIFVTTQEVNFRLKQENRMKFIRTVEIVYLKLNFSPSLLVSLSFSLIILNLTINVK